MQGFRALGHSGRNRLNRLSRSLMLGALAAFGIIPFAAAQSGAQDTTPRLVENVEVNVINVDVIVTDRKA